MTLSGANTFNGALAVNTGSVVSVSSINSVVGGLPSSNLGAPTTAVNSRINLGGNGGSGTLLYTGTGETTDRAINLSGGTAGAGTGIIDQSGSGLLKFTSAMQTTAGDIPKFLMLQGSTSGTGEFAGAIADRSAANTTSVTKNGTGKWTLSGVNTYTGSTTVNAGTLALGVANSISTTSLVTLNGGTLGTGGLTQNLTLGTTPAPLNLLNNSAIDLGSGSSTLTFADSSGQGWSGNLNIVHWNSGLDHVIFGNSSSALNGTQLGSQVSFATYAPGVNISASGEITPLSLTRVLTKGDWSLDGVLNTADVPAALTALTDLNKYMSDNGLTLAQLNTVGDYDGGGVSNRDIQPLLDDVALHGSGSVAAVPEPGTVLLLCIGAVMAFPMIRASRRRRNQGASN